MIKSEFQSYLGHKLTLTFRFVVVTSPLTFGNNERLTSQRVKKL